MTKMSCSLLRNLYFGVRSLDKNVFKENIGGATFYQTDSNDIQNVFFCWLFELVPSLCVWKA